MNHILLYNGHIFTMETEQHFDWILIRGHRISRLGQKNERPSLTERNTETINLNGGTVIPAFGDSHFHLISTALKMEQIDLEPCKSVSDVLELLSGVRPLSAGDWILGTGYNRNVWSGTDPHRDQLDRIFPDHPVALASKDLHALWVNSPALILAGISDHTPDPPGGKIFRDDHGRPTGLLHESACESVYHHFNEITPDRLKSLLHKVAEKLFSLGITSVNAIEEVSTWEYLRDLSGRQALPFRITCHLPQRHLDLFVQNGMVSGQGNNWLRLGGVKFFTDGSLGSQTADLFESYDSRPGYTGISIMEEEELTRRVRLAARNGLSSTIHAIGDRAVHKTLNAFGSARQWQEKFHLHQRMEHAQLIQNADLPRFREYYIIASMQPSHIADDVEIADLHWGARSHNAYPVRSLLEHGATIAFGSDSPVTSPDPLKGIYSAVRRKYQFNSLNPTWYPDQTISVAEAVRAYTSGTAMASYSDAHLGTLSPGKKADLTLLDRNIFKSSPEELLQTSVLMTIMDGSVVHSRL